MPKKTIDNKPIMLRLSNLDVIEMIGELDEAKIYKSKNELINKMLEYGAPELYTRIFGKAKYTKVTTSSSVELILEKLDEMTSRQRSSANTENELFSLLSIIEFLTTTLLNIELAKANGETVTEGQVTAGLYSTLPPKLEALKNKLAGRLD